MCVCAKVYRAYKANPKLDNVKIIRKKASESLLYNAHNEDF